MYDNKGKHVNRIRSVDFSTTPAPENDISPFIFMVTCVHIAGGTEMMAKTMAKTMAKSLQPY
jgi:hypothetical protein